MSLIAALLTIALQQAPATAPPTDSTIVDEVVVEGSRIREAIDEYIAAVPYVRRGGRLSRWPGYICAEVINMRPDHAQALLDRLAQRAAAVGVRSGGPGCEANITIVLAQDGDQVAHQLASERRTSMMTILAPGAPITRSPRQLNAWTRNGRPVRWWPVMLPFNDTMLKSFIVLDAEQIGAVRFSALADYVAMVTLAQIDPGADTRQLDSILNLFDGESSRQTLSGLTDWDQAYLLSLYEARWNARVVGQQRNDVRRRMGDRLAGDDSPLLRRRIPEESASQRPAAIVLPGEGSI